MTFDLFSSWSSSCANFSIRNWTPRVGVTPFWAAEFVVTVDATWNTATYELPNPYFNQGKPHPLIQVKLTTQWSDTFNWLFVTSNLPQFLPCSCPFPAACWLDPKRNTASLVQHQVFATAPMSSSRQVHRRTTIQKAWKACFRNISKVIVVENNSAENSIGVKTLWDIFIAYLNNDAVLYGRPGSTGSPVICIVLENKVTLTLIWLWHVRSLKSMLNDVRNNESRFLNLHLHLNTSVYILFCFTEIVNKFS